MLDQNYKIGIIHSNGKTAIELNGTPIALLSGLSTLVEQLYKNGINKEMIQYAVDLAFLTPTEAEKKAKDNSEKLKAIKKFLEDMM